MSFLSKLLKGLAIGGAGLGTVLTAGAASPALAGALGMGASTAALGGAAATAGSGILSKIGKIASGVSQIAGPLASGVAAGAQKGREAENTAAQDAALFKLKESGQAENQLMDRQTLQLKQREQAQQQRDQAYKLARQSALAKNMKDVTVSGVPSGPIAPGSIPTIQFNGGLRPSAFGKEGMDAATEMNRQAMKSLMNGEQFDTLPAIERTATPAFKTPGALENIAGGIATGAGAINGYNDAKATSSLNERIMAALASLANGPQAGPKINTAGLRTALGTATQPTAAGVTPFWKPPVAQYPQSPYDPYADQSNRG